MLSPSPVRGVSRDPWTDQEGMSTMPLMLKIAAGLAVCAAVLAGCGSSSAKPATSATSGPVGYLARLHAIDAGKGGSGTLFADHTDAEILSAGQSACRFLARPDLYPYGPANQLVGAGFLAVHAAEIGYAARVSLCKH